MRVAFTSKDGSSVDEHFGKTEHFYVWDVGPEDAKFVERVSAIVRSEDEEDRTVARATAIAGCTIVYTVAIGGPAAAKLVSRRIHPMKTNSEIPVSEVVGRLQEVLRGKPPPWLRKALNGGGPEIPEDA